ncbi:MAG: glycosyltransferase [Deferribacteres bacterium]|nr:glycosyltransferase [Deferribacteres bacterium]
MTESKLIAEAEKLFINGDVERARTHFEKALEEYPYNSEILNNLGVIAHESGDPYTAEAYFLRAIDNDGTKKDSYLNLLPVLCEIGSVTRAALLAEFMAMKFPQEKDVKTQVEQVITFLAEDFAAKIPELMASYWHDRNILKYSELLQFVLTPPQDKIQDSEAARLIHAIGMAARGDAYIDACKFMNPHAEIDNKSATEYLLLACFWLAANRIYESRLFASYLINDSKYGHLAKRLIECTLARENSKAVAEAYKDILVIMEEGIGNMVMLTPALQAIHHRLPMSKITVLCTETASQIIDDLPFVDKTITTLPNKKYSLVLSTIWAQQSSKKYAKALQHQADFIFNAQFRIGIDHEIEANFRLANFLGHKGPIPLPQVCSESCELVDYAGKELAILANTTVNNNGWERKRWPHYVQLAEKLLDDGYQVAVIGGPEEAKKFPQNYWPQGVQNLQGKLSLKETAGLIAKCSLFIGNDSGPAHMAAALGVPTFVLFGPSLVSKNKPVGKNVHVLSKELPCSPCQYTDRWAQCKDWQCMASIAPDWVFDQIKRPSAPNACLVQRKDTEPLKLIRKQNKLLVKDGATEEPLRVHLVGKGVTNFPWGMETEMHRVFESLGCEVLQTDYVAHANDFANRFFRPAHLMLVFRGSGIPGELIGRVPYKTVLWYQDDVFAAGHVRKDLAYNARFFDHVYTFDTNAIDEYKKYAVQQISWLPLGATPEVYHKQFLPKKYDVSFVGNIYPNRKALFQRLSKKFNLHVTQAFAKDAAKIYNESKIVLNLGIGKTGIQQRVFEVLCCGSFLLTNEIPAEGRVFEDKEHLVYFNDENIEQLIEYYLQHEEEREAIALAGYRKAVTEHTFIHRAERILTDHFDYESESQRDQKSGKMVRDRAVIPGFVPLKSNELKEKLQQRKLRIFAAFRQFNWENENLQPALEKFGEVIRYDWYPEYSQYNENWHHKDKHAMNHTLFSKVREAHYNGGIDIFFGYLSGRLVFPATIRAIRKLGIPAVNLYLDDVKGFWGNFEPSGFSSMVDIASAFDLCITNHENALDWYASQGTDSIFLPSGANPDIYKPLSLQSERDIDVLFIGQKYGTRPRLIQFLQENEINAQAYGKGWENGEVSTEKMIELYNRAHIVLGIGEASIGGAKKMQIKGRDFEVPMAGALYLTQENPELETWFKIGEEIAVYCDKADLLEKVKYYLANPERANALRQNARSRCVAGHSWEARFQQAFEKLVEIVESK